MGRCIRRRGCWRGDCPCPGRLCGIAVRKSEAEPLFTTATLKTLRVGAFSLGQRFGYVRTFRSPLRGLTQFFGDLPRSAPLRGFSWAIIASPLRGWTGGYRRVVFMCFHRHRAPAKSTMTGA